VSYTLNARVSDLREPEAPVDQTLEETIERQTLEVDLKQAVMACLSGGESRRWAVGELVERFKSLSICASKAAVTAALADLEVELQLAGWAPWQLIERGTEWILVPKTELSSLLLASRNIPFKKDLSEEHKAVLLVVIGYRRKGGVSKTRVGEILGFDSSAYLEDLWRQELIYSDPARHLHFWRPTQSALLSLGFRSFADIPALRELEAWFEASERGKAPALDSYFSRVTDLQSRRRKRELERRQSVGFGTRARCEKRRSDFSGSQGGPLPHPDQESPERVVQGGAA
jgi:chromosome segregation and condensation protein ScpB